MRAEIDRRVQRSSEFEMLPFTTIRRSGDAILGMTTYYALGSNTGCAIGGPELPRRSILTSSQCHRIEL